MKTQLKKSYVLGGVAIILVILVLLIIKLTFKDDTKVATDLGKEAKAESFTPATQPTISTDEKVMGSTKAAVKIVVYEDYSNIFSADNAENIKKLEDEFGNKIVVAVRPFASREKPVSLDAAMAIECASDQGKWEEMREGVFRAVKSDSLNMDGINGWAKQIGLDQEKFNQCLTDTEKQGIMLQVATDAQKFSVYGAPTVFVNNELVIGARPYDDYTDETGTKIEGLKSLVARQIAK
jgi:Protein-disulfide isomerase